MTATHYDVIIVGAGPAGVGLGSLFKQTGLENFTILEKNEVGSTFLNWPKETRLLTPSFPGHGFGLLDLNAVVPSTSPGYAYDREHLSGEDYADYLKRIADHFELPVQTGITVERVHKENERFFVETSSGVFQSEFVVWAGGEYQYPERHPFPGAGHCVHSSDVGSWTSVQEGHHYIIGGYESGIDAAYHLVLSGKEVTVLAKGEPWNNDDPDPSVSLSPFTSERLDEVIDRDELTLLGDAQVAKVDKKGERFYIHLLSGEVIESETVPFIATGYKSSLTLIFEHFYWEDNGNVRLTESDESTVTDGLFLTGPQVKHAEVIFCFIYKFRQRFAVIAKEILVRLGLPVNDEVFNEYRKATMYLDDLSCCDNSCQC
ncbi:MULTISPECIES: NAD(P)/FAD-dependent oxidoreductase [Alteribacter]|uniref:NAD-binding site protein n=1 Tax=Alteribacter keqinensis TaxID=2483800 RepID=A0A3M7TRK6_9BACI|nr:MULTISPECIES: NAD(P)/FAD-dependent oxidoreductase [Alteribacter]MBM7095255.1 NAD(P)-binding domain-containing protein [Alteribacter salitolerans]RNA67000.1 NAD-binding site protein [Alteribacter keqinensis]